MTDKAAPVEELNNFLWDSAIESEYLKCAFSDDKFRKRFAELIASKLEQHTAALTEERDALKAEVGRLKDLCLSIGTERDSYVHKHLYQLEENAKLKAEVGKLKGLCEALRDSSEEDITPMINFIEKHHIDVSECTDSMDADEVGTFVIQAALDAGKEQG